MNESGTFVRIWKAWIALLAVAAFGPLLDVLTNQPVNWALGLLVLLAWLVVLVLWWRARTRTISEMGHVIRAHPVGVAFAFYIFYNLLEMIRPDTSTLQTLFALRWPLIGFASYWMTVLIKSRLEWESQWGRRMSQFMQVVVIVSLLAALYGLFQFAVGLDRLQAWGLTQPSETYVHYQSNFMGGVKIFRIFGPLRRNEAFGAFLYLGLVFSITAYLAGLAPKRLSLASILTSFVALALTLSLASIGTFVLWLVGILVFLPRFRRYLLITGAVAVAGLVVLNFALGGLVTSRVMEHLTNLRNGAGRFGLISNWSAEMTDRGLVQGMIGTGVCTGLNEATLDRIGGVLGSVGVHIGSDTLFNCDWQRKVQDTWYGTMSLEIGWLGLLLFWLPFGLLAFNLFKQLRGQEPGGRRDLSLALGWGALALWPSGWLGALIAYMPVTAYFWTLVAISEPDA